MQLDNTFEAMDRFGRVLKKESRTALTKKKKNASKELYKSIDYKLIVSKNSFQFNFVMDDYGDFVNYGVTGKGDAGFKGKKKQVQRSLNGYRYGSGNFKGRGKEWERKIDRWMYSRGIAPRDNKTGKFIKRDTANYLIRRSIYQHGQKPTEFYTKPYYAAFKKLPKEIVEGYGLDAMKFLKSSMK